MDVFIFEFTCNYKKMEYYIQNGVDKSIPYKTIDILIEEQVSKENKWTGYNYYLEYHGEPLEYTKLPCKVLVAEIIKFPSKFCADFVKMFMVSMMRNGYLSCNDTIRILHCYTTSNLCQCTDLDLIATILQFVYANIEDDSIQSRFKIVIPEILTNEQFDFIMTYIASILEHIDEQYYSFYLDIFLKKRELSHKWYYCYDLFHTIIPVFKSREFINDSVSIMSVYNTQGTTVSRMISKVFIMFYQPNFYDHILSPLYMEQMACGKLVKKNDDRYNFYYWCISYNKVPLPGDLIKYMLSFLGIDEFIEDLNNGIF